MQNSFPVLSAVAGLFEQLALGGSERRFAIVDASGGQFPHHRLCGVAILALEQDAWLGLATRLPQIINRQHNDGAGMPYDVASSPHTTRLFHLIGRDAEHRALATTA